MEPTILHRRRAEEAVVCKINLLIEHRKDYPVAAGEVVEEAEAEAGVEEEEEEGEEEEEDEHIFKFIANL